jgi:hypothetical protein
VEPAFPLDPAAAAHVLGATDPFATLLRAVADVRVADAAAARARAHWLVRQAEEEGTLVGVLVDLAERGDRLVVSTTTGRRAAGTVQALGADFVALADGAGLVLVALTALATVRTRPGAAAASGDRTERVERRLLDVLAELAGDRPPVVVGTVGDEVRGTLRAVGRDVITIRMDGERPSTVYVAAGSITDIRLS